MLFEESRPNIIHWSIWRSRIDLCPANSAKPLDTFVAAFSDLRVFRYFTLYRDIVARHNDDCSIGRTAESLTVCAVTCYNHICVKTAWNGNVSAVAFSIDMNLFNQGLFLCNGGLIKHRLGKRSNQSRVSLISYTTCKWSELKRCFLVSSSIIFFCKHNPTSNVGRDLQLSVLRWKLHPFQRCHLSESGLLPIATHRYKFYVLGSNRLHAARMNKVQLWLQCQSTCPPKL